MSNIYDHARPHIRKQISLSGRRFCMDLNGMCKLTDPWACGSKLFFFSILRASAAHAVLKYPREEYTTGRKLRCSPLHTRQEVAGAVFGETMAYERAMYFKVDDDGKFFVVVEPQLHADLLVSSFFKLFFLFFFSFPLWVIGLLHRLFLFCVCLFGQTLTNAVPHKHLYNYVKYTAQIYCESAMDFFFKGLHMDTIYTDSLLCISQT